MISYYNIRTIVCVLCIIKHKTDEARNTRNKLISVYLVVGGKEGVPYNMKVWFMAINKDDVFYTELVLWATITPLRCSQNCVPAVKHELKKQKIQNKIRRRCCALCQRKNYNNTPNPRTRRKAYVYC